MGVTSHRGRLLSCDRSRMRLLRRCLFLIGFVCLAVAGVRCGGCNNSANVGGNDGGPDGGPGGDGGPGADGGPNVIVGPSDFAVDGGPGGSGDGVQLGPDGGVVLNSNDTKLHFAWIANAGNGTVSKFDTKSGKEVARYYTVVPRDGSGASSGQVATLRPAAGNSPSRTAIDLFGDVWIANRAPTSGVYGSVTKIANDISSCVDRNGNGRIDTSTDVNGDGVIDTNPSAGEFIVPSNPADPSTYDECVLFSTVLGTNTSSSVKGRALAVSVPPLESGSSAGWIWVGDWAERTVLKLDSSNGQIVGSINLGWGPYGAVVDSQQRLWIAAAPGDITAAKLALIDSKTSTIINNNIVATGIGTTSDYGIAIDGKDRVWLASWNSGPSAYRYDHGPGLDAGVGTWSRFDFMGARSQIGTGFGDSRGIGADDQGIIWMSGHRCSSNNPACGASGTAVAQLIGFNAEDGGVKQFNLSTGGTADFIDATAPSSSPNPTYESIGVGPDSDNNLWVNDFSGNAMKIDRNTGDVFKTPNQGGSLYTYSDFTGYQLRHFTAPRGTYWRDLQGCGTNTRWMSVTWDAYTPPRTAVQLYVKVGPTLASLNDTGNPQYGPFTLSPANLQVAPGPVPRNLYMRVLFVLTSQDRQSTPVLNSFNVTWTCSGGLG